MENLISAGVVLILRSVTLGQNPLEYKTAKVKKQSRINKWWSAGAVLFSIGAILLIIWVYSRDATRMGTVFETSL